MKVKALNHVGVTVGDFSKAVSWYHKHFHTYLISELELPVEEVNELFDLYHVKDVSVRIGFLRLPKGGVLEIFKFSQDEECSKVWNTHGFTHCTVEVRDIHKWYDYMKANNIKVLTKPRKNNGTHWFFVEDPWGNPIELMDMHAQYMANRLFGKLLGWYLKKSKFQHHYNE